MFSVGEVEVLVQEKKEGIINTRVMMKTVMDIIKQMPELEDIVNGLDYVSTESIIHDRNDNIYPKLETSEYVVEAIVNEGGNEGVYIDCFLTAETARWSPENRLRLATIKTLREGLGTHMEMGRLAGAITYIGDWYLCVNCRRIESQNKPLEQKAKPKSRSI